MSKNYKFQLFVVTIFVLICFSCASGLAFLLSLNFLFTRNHYISVRDDIFGIPSWNFNPGWKFRYNQPLTLLYFNPGWNFSYNCNFLTSVYPAETSTRDENLHIINLLNDSIDIWNCWIRAQFLKKKIIIKCLTIKISVWIFLLTPIFTTPKKQNSNSTLSYNRKIWVDIPSYIIFPLLIS